MSINENQHTRQIITAIKRLLSADDPALVWESPGQYRFYLTQARRVSVASAEDERQDIGKRKLTKVWTDTQRISKTALERRIERQLIAEASQWRGEKPDPNEKLRRQTYAQDETEPSGHPKDLTNFLNEIESASLAANAQAAKKGSKQQQHEPEQRQAKARKDAQIKKALVAKKAAETKDAVEGQKAVEPTKTTAEPIAASTPSAMDELLREKTVQSDGQSPESSSSDFDPSEIDALFGDATQPLGDQQALGSEQTAIDALFGDEDTAPTPAQSEDPSPQPSADQEAAPPSDDDIFSSFGAYAESQAIPLSAGAGSSAVDAGGGKKTLRSRLHELTKKLNNNFLAKKETPTESDQFLFLYDEEDQIEAIAEPANAAEQREAADKPRSETVSTRIPESTAAELKATESKATESKVTESLRSVEPPEPAVTAEETEETRLADRPESAIMPEAGSSEAPEAMRSVEPPEPTTEAGSPPHAMRLVEPRESAITPEASSLESNQATRTIAASDSAISAEAALAEVLRSTEPPEPIAPDQPVEPSHPDPFAGSATSASPIPPTLETKSNQQLSEISELINQINTPNQNKTEASKPTSKKKKIKVRAGIADLSKLLDEMLEERQKPS